MAPAAPPAGPPDGHAEKRREEQQADEAAPQGAARCSGRAGLEALVQLDLAVSAMLDDDGVVDRDRMLDAEFSKRLDDILRGRHVVVRDGDEVAH